MDYLEATQILEDRQTIDSNNDKQPKLIGTLSVGSEEYRIMEGLNRIGRSPVCPVVLEDPTVSKVHAEIHASSDASFITDLRSANGTTLKNLSLKTFFFYPINDGDVIAFGRVKAIYATTKKTLERSSVDVTPKTPVAKTGASRTAATSSTRHQDDLSFEDGNDSIIPGSQRNDKRRRLFRRPEMPHFEAQRNRGRISEIAEKSNKTDDTRIDEDSVDIYNAETQRTVDYPDSVLKSLNGGKTKRLNKSNESPKDVKITEDIHEMETQDILNPGVFLARLTKRPRLEEKPVNANLVEEHIDENIFEAETQVPVEAAKLPILVTADRQDTDDEEADKSRPRSDKCQVIAETDDETNELSDESVTDNENEFASLRPISTNKEPSEVSLVRGVQRSKVESGIQDAETQRMEDFHRETAPRARSTARLLNDDDDDDDVVDIDLMPTQILNAATSTPMSRPTKSPASSDFDESAPVIDYQDIHTALTQVVPEKNRDIVDSSGRPGNSPAGRKAERNESPDTTINSTGDGLEKKLGNIFGNEATSDAEPTDEPTQLMTQNLVDILKMTQSSSAREATASPALPERPPVEVASSAKVARKSSSPVRQSTNGAAEILGFVDGRAVGSHHEFPRTPTSSGVKNANETPRSDVNNGDRTDDEADEKNGLVESSMLSRKRPRVTAIMRNGRTAKRIGESLEEGPSRKVDNDLPPLTVKCKAHAKVQLTRLNDIEVRIKKNEDVQSDLDASKVTRPRRSTPKTTRESESSPKPRAKNRKTIGPIVSSPYTRNEQHKVLFTGVKDEDYENMVVKLGGVVVSDPSKASVLITDKIRRTFKFLCAVAQGTKIVSVKWLIESNDAGHFLDCDSFTLRDPVAEDKFKFKLAKSLSNARTRKLLEGFTIIVTPKVNQPDIHELKGMAEACGGRILVRAGRSWDEKTVILSREDDLAAAKAILSKAPKSLKISVQSTEFLLTGILRQEINLVDHKLL